MYPDFEAALKIKNIEVNNFPIINIEDFIYIVKD